MAPCRTPDDPQSRVRKFVGRLAEEGGFERYWVRIHGESLNRAEKETILRHCRPARVQAAALDAGCGEGRLTLPLARMYRHVYAIDFAEESCARLRTLVEEDGARNVTTWCQDLRSPIKIRDVDTIVLAQVLQHFDNLSDRLEVLRNLRECLKVGGRILLTVFNYDRLWNRMRRGKADVDKNDGYVYYHYFRIQELNGLMSAAGFGNIKVGGCINLPAFLHELEQGRFLWKWDAMLSTHQLSRYLGIYLLACAERL